LLTDVLVGNAVRDSASFRGWFVGHFMPLGLAHSDAVEVKWGTHARNEVRQHWGVSRAATTLSILVQGSIRLYFEDGEHVLSEPGDYGLWGPGIKHRWRIEADDTVILTVRWPSRAGDASDL
jgi:hypothetical protein